MLSHKRSVLHYFLFLPQQSIHMTALKLRDILVIIIPDTYFHKCSFCSGLIADCLRKGKKGLRLSFSPEIFFFTLSFPSGWLELSIEFYTMLMRTAETEMTSYQLTQLSSLWAMRCIILTCCIYYIPFGYVTKLHL